MESVEIVSLSDIVAAEKDVEYKTVPGFKPNQFFRIQSLTAGDLIEWSEANEGEAKRTAGLRLIVKSAVDKDGKRIMGDEHIAVLRKMKHKKADEVVEEILALNGMKVKAADAKKS